MGYPGGIKMVGGEPFDPGEALAELRSRLQAALVDQRMSKSVLTRRAGLGRTTVSRAFSVSAPAPSAQTVSSIAAALGLAPGPLLRLRTIAVSQAAWQGAGGRGVPMGGFGERLQGGDSTAPSHRGVDPGPGTHGDSDWDEEVQAALAAYAVRVRQTYAHLELDVLTPLSDQGDHPPVALRKVFVVPGLRADPPPVELPRELIHRLMESGDLAQEWEPSLEAEASSQELGPSDDAEFMMKVQEAVDRLRDSYRRKPVIDALTVLTGEAGRRIVLLGDPGAGKSTLARYLALTLSRSVPLDGPLAALADHVPLIVELREYAAAEWRQRTFEDFIAHLHATRGMAPPPPLVHKLLDRGQALVVFDGLDELFDPRIRYDTHHRIAAFAARYPAARVIVTSRAIGYQRAVLDNAEFSHHMLQDLDGPQISDFSHRWYALSCRHDSALAERLAGQLLAAVTDSRPVRELAGNPLLLTILAIIGRRKILPRDRRGVYEHAVTVLVAHWDQQAKHLETQLPDGVASTLDALGERERTRLLQLLARAMQEGTGGIAGNHIHGSDLERLIGEHLRARYEIPPPLAATCSRAMVAQLRERNFILSRYGGEVYGFVHRAFLEYLAATDIIQRIKDDWDRTPRQYVEEIVTAHAGDPAWHEVLLLLIGELGERAAAAAVDRILLLHRKRSDLSDVSHVVLALRALAEVGAVGGLAEQSIAVVDAVTAVLDEPVEEARSLLERDKDRSAADTSGYADVLMPRAIASEQEDAGEYRPLIPAAIAPFQTFGPYWIGRDRYLRWYHLCGQFGDLGTEAAELAVALHPDRAELCRLAAGSFFREDRELFLKALADRWMSQSETRAFIAQRVACDIDSEVRFKAAVLLRDWPGDYPGLLNRLSVEPEDKVRRELAGLLVNQWPHSPEVRAQLGDCAITDRDIHVRLQVIEGLVQRWPDRTDVRDLLVAAASVVYGEPAEVATQALAARADRDESLVPVLGYLAEAHPSHLVRGAAMPSVLNSCSQDEARRLLSMRAVCDKEARLREAAVRTLARMWPQDADVRNLLRTLASEDSAAMVRLSALTALVACAAREEARAMLARRVSNEPAPDVRSAALRWLIREWPEEDGTWILWSECLFRDESSVVRQSAVLALGEGDLNRTDVREILAATAVHDTEPAVRAVAANALAQSGDLDGQAVLLVLGRTDEAVDVRLSAISQLSTGYARDEAMVSFLTDRVRQDLSSAVRVAALTTLIESHSDEDPVRTLLAEQVCQDPEYHVRRGLLEAWIAGTNLPPLTTTVLMNIAGNDPEPTLRLTALNHLIHQHGNEDPVQTLLAEQVCHDPDHHIRRTLLEAWIAGTNLPPLTTTVLMNIAGNDPEPTLRLTALNHLIHQHGNEDPVQTLLAEIRASHPAGGTGESLRMWDEKADPTTDELLLARVACDIPLGSARWAATLILAERLSPEQADRLLAERVLEDPDWKVRRAALSKFARKGIADEKRHKVLRLVAAEDAHPTVRWAALARLTRYESLDPDLRALLTARADLDPDRDVRWKALKALAALWDDDDVRALFAARAAEDPDRDLRWAATVVMANRWGGDATAVDQLRTQAQAAPDSESRWLALAALAELPADQEMPLLKARADDDPEPLVRQAAFDVYQRATARGGALSAFGRSMKSG
ncbi:HEAT repeat domain-containing protein [Streptomyces aureus]|uniref:HEAT repeat domain-containing protein n=1 Tax=Streptomyces aureus TaxID=193461 RepID=UPI0033C89448